MAGEMIERMARAIVKELSRQDDGDPWTLVDGKLAYLDQGEVDFFAVARAALAAMDPPTEAMIEAAVENVGPIGCCSLEEKEAREIWSAMLAKAKE